MPDATEWKEGPDMLQKTNGASFVESEDGSKLYLLGGLEPLPWNTIHSFDCPNSGQCQWTKLDRTLSFGRMFFQAIRVPESFAAC